MYALCNKFIRHDMQDMLHHIYTTLAQSNELCERGYLLSPGANGDPRWAAAHRSTMQPSQTLDDPGVDCNVAYCGGIFFYPHISSGTTGHMDSTMDFNLSEECQLLWQRCDPWLMCFRVISPTAHIIRRKSKTFSLQLHFYNWSKAMAMPLAAVAGAIC